MVKVIREMLQRLFHIIQRHKGDFRHDMDDDVWFIRDSFLFYFVDFKKTVVFEKFFKFHIQHVPFNDYSQEGYNIHISKLLHYVIKQYPIFENYVRSEVDVINDGYVPGNFWIDMDQKHED